VSFTKTYIRVCNPRTAVEDDYVVMWFDVEALPELGLGGGTVVDGWSARVHTSTHSHVDAVPISLWIGMVVTHMSQVVIEVEPLERTTEGDGVRVKPRFLGQADPEDGWQRAVIEYVEGQSDGRLLYLKPAGALDDPDRSALAGIARDFVDGFLGAIRRYESSLGLPDRPDLWDPPEPGILATVPRPFLVRIANPRECVEEGVRKVAADVELLEDAHLGDGEILASLRLRFRSSDDDMEDDARFQQWLKLTEVMTNVVLDIAVVAEEEETDLVRVGAAWLGEPDPVKWEPAAGLRFVQNNAVLMLRVAPPGLLRDPARVGEFLSEVALRFTAAFITAFELCQEDAAYVGAETGERDSREDVMR